MTDRLDARSAPDLSELGQDALLEMSQSGDWLTRARFRAACRRSLYFMTKTVSCWAQAPNLMTKRSFLESSEWLQWVITKHKLGLFGDPRNHIKSYRSTVTIPNWLAIQRPHDEHDHPAEIERALQYLEDHPSLKGTDSRIIVACETQSRAKDWVGQARDQWSVNPIQIYAFPEYVWDNYPGEKPRLFTREEFYLPLRQDPSLPDGYLRAMGITTAESGGRADGMIVDDLISEKSNESASELGYRSRWLQSAPQLLEVQDYTDPLASFILYVNNRWNYDDPSSMIHDEKHEWAIWHRGATRCIVHDFGNCGRRESDADTDCAPMVVDGKPAPIWPERHKDLEAIRKARGDDIYFTQWENDPSQIGDLSSDDLVSFALQAQPVTIDGVTKREMCAIIPDQTHPVSGEIIAVAETIPLSHLRGHLISIDPASADEESEARKAGKTARSCVTWTAHDPPTGRTFCLHYAADHWAPDDTIAAIYETWVYACGVLDARITDIYCEKVAAQTFVASSFRFFAQAKSKDIKKRVPGPSTIAPLIQGIPRRRGDKDDRIKKRVGFRLGQHKLLLREGLALPRVEIRRFPKGFKDWLDTIAQAEEKYLEIHGATGKADARTKARKRVRRRRRASAGMTGVW